MSDADAKADDDNDSDAPPPRPQTPQQRVVAIAVCCAAAIAHSWLANPEVRSVGVGLLSTEHCDPISERCESKSNGDVIEELSRSLPVDERWIGQAPDAPSSWFPRFGVVTFALALIAAAGLLGAAAIALAKKRPELPIT